MLNKQIHKYIEDSDIRSLYISRCKVSNKTILTVLKSHIQYVRVLFQRNGIDILQDRAEAGSKEHYLNQLRYKKMLQTSVASYWTNTLNMISKETLMGVATGNYSISTTGTPTKNAFYWPETQTITLGSQYVTTLDGRIIKKY